MTTLDDLRRARMFLLDMASSKPAATRELVAACGPVDAAERIRARAARQRGYAIRDPYAPTLDEYLADDLQVIESGYARLLIPEDDEWPDQLGALAECGLHAPIALWVRGDASLRKLTGDGVTVTGTRAATGYGKTIAAEIGGRIARHNTTVVTGGALGIESSVLTAVMSEQGRAVVVLPGGLRHLYPPANERLLSEVPTSGGLLISEYPVTARLRLSRFRDRCRLLAALAPTTLIVEAARRGSPMTTAAHARALGRSVLAVPGPITSAYSAGSNELLRAGHATAITHVDHVP